MTLLTLFALLVGCQRTTVSGRPQPDKGSVLITVSDSSLHKTLIDACVAQAGGRPWLILHHDVMIVQVDDVDPSSIAILPPLTETKRVRRGKAVCNRRLLQYAQVAPEDRPFHGVYELPSVKERPFILYGDLSDKDLSSLFDYLWAHEFEREWYAKEYVISVSTIHHQQGGLEGTIEVTTQRGSAGHTLYLKRGTFGWKVVSIGNWVS